MSADGDWRMLNGMLHHTDLNILGDEEKCTARTSETLCFLQDIVHILTKLRNRLLKASMLFLLGNKLISVSHLKILINEVSKAEHGLVFSDICPDDRQNYRSFEKVMEERVVNGLTENVIGSEGTIMYIRLSKDIKISLYDDNVHPLVRIGKIWETTYFLRAWRKWLHDMDKSVEDNFISRNAYACIELNATNLVLLAKSFRNQNKERLFMPSLFNSQPNEETFRQLRSMGTMNFTKINFTLLELFHLVGRIELQNDIVYVKLADINISFPRNKINEMTLNQFELPSDVEIEAEISKAKLTAINNAAKFGINVTPDEISECQLEKTDVFKKKYYRKKMKPMEYDQENTEHSSIASEHDDALGPLIEITLENGTKKTVRKSTFIWTLTESKQKLSSDRLKRVRDASDDVKPKKRRRLEFKKSVSPNLTVPILTLVKRDELQIGEWVIFQYQKLIETNELVNVFVLGNIVSFKYINGKTEKDRSYSWDFAPVSPDHNCQKRGLEVLASWFQIAPHDLFKPVMNINSFYINIEQYMTSMVCSTVKLVEEDGVVSVSLTNDQNVSERILFELSRIST